MTHSGIGQGVHSSAVCSRILTRRAGLNPRSYWSEGPLPDTKKGRKSRSKTRSAGETQATHLVIGADGSDVNDGIGIVKERRPCVSLPTGTADVVQSPLHGAIAVMHHKSVLRDANGLDPGVKDIIDSWHIATFGDPIDLIKEAIRWRLWSAWRDGRHIPYSAKPEVRRTRARHETHNSDHSSKRIFFFSNSLVTAG